MEVQNVIIKMMLEIDFMYVLQTSKCDNGCLGVLIGRELGNVFHFMKGYTGAHYEMNVTFTANYILLSGMFDIFFRTFQYLYIIIIFFTLLTYIQSCIVSNCKSN